MDMDKFLGFDEIWIDDINDDIIRVGDYVKCINNVFCFAGGGRWIDLRFKFKAVYLVVNICIYDNICVLCLDGQPDNLWFMSDCFEKVK